jgi:hypothetical protein
MSYLKSVIIAIFFIATTNNIVSNNLLGDLMVIYTTRDSVAIQPYIKWKTEVGFNVIEVKVEKGTHPKDTIQATYESNNNLKYILLVGDADDIKSDEGIMADANGFFTRFLKDPTLGYVKDNNNLPDIAIGRFSANNSKQISNQVNKTIAYERDTKNNSNWLNSCLGIASSIVGGDDNESDDQHIENIYTNKLKAFGYSNYYSAYSSGTNSTAKYISECIDNGVGIINYAGHGTSYSWSTTGFSNTNINALSNNGKYPIIISTACLNGNFKDKDSFAEAWLRKKDAGAVFSLMSAVSQSWLAPMRGQDYIADLIIGGYNYDNHSTQIGINNSKQETRIGDIIREAFELMLEESEGVDVVEAIESWISFGDPSLQIRTKQPEQITISNHEIYKNQPFTAKITTINGDPVENAIVSIIQGRNKYVKKSNKSGEVHFTDTFSEKEAIITVTAYNTTSLQKISYNKSISFSDTVLTPSAKSGNLALRLNVYGKWEIEENSDWVNLSKSNGTNSEILKIEISENSTSSSREAILLFKSNGETKEIKIEQQAKNTTIFKSSKSKLNIGTKSIKYPINIFSNTNWKISPQKEWIQIEDNLTQNGFVILNIDSNEYSFSRKDSLIISNEDKNLELLIEQKANKREFNIPKSININEDHSASNMRVNTNFYWKAKTNTDWINIDTTQKLGTQNLTLNTKLNNSFIRKGSINFYNSNEKFHTITITQNGITPIINTNIDKNNINKTGGKREIEINSNGKCKISVNQPWVKLERSNLTPNINNKINLTIEENNSYVRDFIITIIHEAGLTRKIKLTQDGIIREINISQDTVTIQSQATPTSLNIKSNCEWVIDYACSWMQNITPSKGNGNKTINFYAYDNKNTKDRFTTITISSENIKKTAIVKQLATDKIFKINTDIIEVDATTKKLSYSINSNFEWELLTASDSWINFNQTRGNGDVSLKLNFSPNKTGKIRKGTLSFAVYNPTPFADIKIMKSIEVVQQPSKSTTPSEPTDPQTSIDENIDNDKIKLFPNPCVNHFKIKHHENKASIYLYNQLGKLILFKKNINSEESVYVDSLPKAIYYLKFNSENKNKLFKVIKN